MPSRRLRVLIHVADADLARALETSLRACGTEPQVCERLADISPALLFEQSMLLVDLDIIAGRARKYLAERRAAGWRGLAVLLADDCRTSAAHFDSADGVLLLMKPFGGPEIVAAVRRARKI